MVNVKHQVRTLGNAVEARTRALRLHELRVVIARDHRGEVVDMRRRNSGLRSVALAFGVSLINEGNAAIGVSARGACAVRSTSCSLTGAIVKARRRNAILAILRIMDVRHNLCCAERCEQGANLRQRGIGHLQVLHDVGVEHDHGRIVSDGAGHSRAVIHHAVALHVKHIGALRILGKRPAHVRARRIDVVRLLASRRELPGLSRGVIVGNGVNRQAEARRDRRVLACLLIIEAVRIARVSRLDNPANLAHVATRRGEEVVYLNLHVLLIGHRIASGIADKHPRSLRLISVVVIVGVVLAVIVVTVGIRARQREVVIRLILGAVLLVKAVRRGTRHVVRHAHEHEHAQLLLNLRRLVGRLRALGVSRHGVARIVHVLSAGNLPHARGNLRNARLRASNGDGLAIKRGVVHRSLARGPVRNLPINHEGMHGRTRVDGLRDHELIAAALRRVIGNVDAEAGVGHKPAQRFRVNTHAGAGLLHLELARLRAGMALIVNLIGIIIGAGVNHHVAVKVNDAILFGDGSLIGNFLAVPEACVVLLGKAPAKVLTRKRDDRLRHLLACRVLRRAVIINVVVGLEGMRPTGLRIKPAQIILMGGHVRAGTLARPGADVGKLVGVLLQHILRGALRVAQVVNARANLQRDNLVMAEVTIRPDALSQERVIHIVIRGEFLIGSIIGRCQLKHHHFALVRVRLHVVGSRIAWIVGIFLRVVTRRKAVVIPVSLRADADSPALIHHLTRRQVVGHPLLRVAVVVLMLHIEQVLVSGGLLPRLKVVCVVILIDVVRRDDLLTVLQVVEQLIIIERHLLGQMIGEHQLGMVQSANLHELRVIGAVVLHRNGIPRLIGVLPRLAIVTRLGAGYIKRLVILGTLTR